MEFVSNPPLSRSLRRTGLLLLPRLPAHYLHILPCPRPGREESSLYRRGGSSPKRGSSKGESAEWAVPPSSFFALRRRRPRPRPPPPPPELFRPALSYPPSSSSSPLLLLILLPSPSSSRSCYLAAAGPASAKNLRKYYLRTSWASVCFCAFLLHPHLKSRKIVPLLLLPRLPRTAPGVAQN